jgi:hypothetical protein
LKKKYGVQKEILKFKTKKRAAGREPYLPIQLPGQ